MVGVTPGGGPWGAGGPVPRVKPCSRVFPERLWAVRGQSLAHEAPHRHCHGDKPGPWAAPQDGFRGLLWALAVSSADGQGRPGVGPEPRAEHSHRKTKWGPGGLRVCGRSLSSLPPARFSPSGGSWPLTTRRDQNELDLSGVLGILEPQFPCLRSGHFHA